MMSTIAAIATPPGHGGIAIIRISGFSAKDLLARVFLPHSRHFNNFQPWHMHHGAIIDLKGEPLDDALVVYMPGPFTFTGEDVAEIHCHGSPVIAASIMEHLLALGAKTAERGEFTKRAFLNGRMDLNQAEAVAEIISAPTRDALRFGFERLDGNLSRHIETLSEKIEKARQQMCLCLDFPDDEIQTDIEIIRQAASEAINDIDKLLVHTDAARLFQHGAKVVLAGAANAGKSSLLNALTGQNRAIVTPVAGTTRDFLEATINLNGLAVTLVDTAGLREEAETVEAMGIAKSIQQMEDADLVLLLLDASNPDSHKKFDEIDKLLEMGIPVIVIHNKIDLAFPENLPHAWHSNLPSCQISCLTGENLDTLRKLIPEKLLHNIKLAPDNHVAPNLRQSMNLTEAKSELKQLLAGMANGLPLDCCAEHLNAANLKLSEMLGLETDEEVLESIFSKFCIGK